MKPSCRDSSPRPAPSRWGDPRDPTTVIGPLIRESQCGFIAGQIDDALSKGATVCCGGTHRGPFFEATVLGGVTPAMSIYGEESFGPVTSVLRADDYEHALHLANDTRAGLSSAIVTNDLNKALDFAQRSESGMVHINDTTISDEPHIDFGGFKESGFGREGGMASMAEMTEVKWITFQMGKREFPVLTEDRIVDAFVERFVIEPEGDGPLRGKSFAVKDMFDVAGRPTGAGNPAWSATHALPTMSALAVERLLRAGARLVGKTRTDELAYSLEGRNFHEGAPLNPAAPDRLTGGSSSGAASAVAAAEVDFALGSDTAGSIRVPAAWCGLVGFRPTHGRIPVDGLTPLAPSFDTVGWMARSASLMRTVGDVLLAGGAMPMPMPMPMSAVSLVRDPSVDRRCEAGKTAVPPRILERFAVHGLAVTEFSPSVALEKAAECLRVLQAGEVWKTHGRWSRFGASHVRSRRRGTLRGRACDDR